MESTPLTVTSHRPHTTLVVIKGAQPLPVTREPHIDDIVLGGRKEEVALGVEDDLGEGALVSLKDDGFLRGSTRRSARVPPAGEGGNVPFWQSHWSRWRGRKALMRGVVDQYNGGDHLAPNFLALASNVALGTGQKPRGRK
jgi:hypothetical protein